MTQSDFSSTKSEDLDNEVESNRQEMLRQLYNKTLAQFDIETSTSSQLGDDYDEADEWEGIQSEESFQSQDGIQYSIAGSEVDFDDPEDLHQSLNHEKFNEAFEREPELIVFRDPSRPLDDESNLNLSNQSDRKSFMASMLKKQNNNQLLQLSNSSTKNLSSKEEKDEANLEHLDRSLSNLISHLSEPSKRAKRVGLDTILSSTLPPLTKDKNPQRHPRKIKEGMVQAELRRSLAADKEALANGTIRSSNSKTLSKKQRRMKTGADARDRRERRNRTDRPLGTSKGPGGMIKLSNWEVKIGMNRSKSKSNSRKV